MLYELLNLTRIFDHRTVLDIPELGMEKKMISAILGPNGSGKTTLLNLLAFLDRPSSGRIRFQGEPAPANGSPLVGLRRKVVLVDQNPILFTTSVYHNLEFGLKIRKIKAAERRTRINRALEMVGLEAFIQARADNLSGGETKRLALARALALKPEVLLCDEPFANVDQENQEKIWQIIHRLNQEQEISIILSSHDRPQAEELAHRILYLKNGRLTEPKRPNSFKAALPEIADHQETLADRLLAGTFQAPGTDKFPGTKPLKTGPPTDLPAAQIQTIEEMILKNLAGGRLPCGTARAIAQALGVPVLAVGQIADHLKIRITKCQMGCF